MCNIHISFSHHEPSLLVLGTFYDRIAESVSESLEEKNACLWSTLKKFRDVHMNYCERENQIIFPVNTIARGEYELKIAEKIRRIVLRSNVEVEIPVRRYLFQLELQSLLQSRRSMFISKQECLRIGLTLKMDQRDVEFLLLYYHDINIFLYFPSVLPNVVFLHPQPLFNNLSELISISFADAVTHLTEMNVILPASAHYQLKYEGTFTRELLDCLPDGLTPDFTADDFLKLMDYIFIIAPLPQKDKYFLPSVLPTTSHLEVIRDPFMKHLDSFIFTWDLKPIPQGLFTALTVSLLKQHASPQFYLHRPSEFQEELMQYHNAIKLLCIDFAGVVLLVDSIYWLEICYSGPPVKCSAIKIAILESLSNVVKKIQYKPILSMPQERFLCSICPHPRSHLCRPDKDREILSCCRDPRITANIDSFRQLPWLINDAATENTKLLD